MPKWSKYFQSSNNIHLPHKGVDDESITEHAEDAKECHPDCHHVVPGVWDGPLNVKLLPVWVDEIVNGVITQRMGSGQQTIHGHCPRDEQMIVRHDGRVVATRASGRRCNCLQYKKVIPNRLLSSPFRKHPNLPIYSSTIKAVVGGNGIVTKCL